MAGVVNLISLIIQYKKVRKNQFFHLDTELCQPMHEMTWLSEFSTAQLRSRPYLAVYAFNKKFSGNFLIFFAGKPSGEAGGGTGNDLLQMTPYEDLNTTLTCLGPEVVTCNIARVQWDVITNNHDIILPTGIDANGILYFLKSLCSIYAQ